MPRRFRQRRYFAFSERCREMPRQRAVCCAARMPVSPFRFLHCLFSTLRLSPRDFCFMPRTSLLPLHADTATPPICFAIVDFAVSMPPPRTRVFASAGRAVCQRFSMPLMVLILRVSPRCCCVSRFSVVSRWVYRRAAALLACHRPASLLADAFSHYRAFSPDPASFFRRPLLLIDC